MKQCPSQHKPYQGFTLIELSIVLVIIGLIIGGIIMGRDMVEAAELRSVTNDVERINTAVNTFRLKYGGLPGDITNASSILPDCSDCDGDGDGIIEHQYVGTPNNYSYHSLKLWGALSKAGLIDGNYTGAPSSPFITLGVNAPVSRMGNTGYMYAYFRADTQTPAAFTGYRAGYFSLNVRHLPAGHWVIFAKPRDTGSDGNFFGQSLSANQAHSLDNKIDDGHPANGRMAIENGHGFVSSDCTPGFTAANPENAQYADSNEVACRAYFRAQ